MLNLILTIRNINKYVEWRKLNYETMTPVAVHDMRLDGTEFNAMVQIKTTLDLLEHLGYDVIRRAENAKTS